MTETNGNVKVGTVSAVVAAVILAVGVVVFILEMNAARCSDIADVSARVGLNEAQMHYMQNTLEEIRADVKVIKARTVTP